ncbi:MAG: hypothetical protein C4339_00375 [Nitrososphaerota archaeon]
MPKVIVHRISSVQDPVLGKRGKQIEFVEVKAMPLLGQLGEGGEEAKLLRSVMSQLQASGLFPPFRDIVFPKLMLTLTEEEYDMLGVNFEVNDVYEVVLKDGSIRFEKSREGV